MPEPRDSDDGVTIRLPSAEAVDELLTLLRTTLTDLQEARAELRAKSAELDALRVRLERSEKAEEVNVRILDAQQEANYLAREQLKLETKRQHEEDQRARERFAREEALLQRREQLATQQSGPVDEYEAHQLHETLSEFATRIEALENTPDEAEAHQLHETLSEFATRIEALENTPDEAEAHQLHETLSEFATRIEALENTPDEYESYNLDETLTEHARRLEVLESKVQLFNADTATSAQPLSVSKHPRPLADRIREYVLRRYIEPAREAQASLVEVNAGDVHRALGLANRVPAVCSAIGSSKFLRYADVELEERSGPQNSTTTTFTFEVL